MQFALVQHFGKHELLLTEGRWRFDALHFDRQLVADENFPARDEPLHVGGFDIVRVEEIAARPNHGGGAVAEAPELFAFKL